MTTADISDLIWASRYRGADRDGAPDSSIADTWSRVARCIAAAERDPREWARRFESALDDFRFLPGGRILAGAGLDKDVTLFNCFVAGQLVDSLQGILESLKETAITMQHGGGIGLDFSPLRPSGLPAIRTGATASGPVSFMRVWDSMCETLLATGRRRGAMMGTLRCDHPDIDAFIDAKRDTEALHNFNLSVLVTDEFLNAVDDDREWSLVYPPGDDPLVEKRIPARELWQRSGSTSSKRRSRRRSPGCCSSIPSTARTISGIAKGSAPRIPAAKFRCHPTVRATLARSTLWLPSPRRSPMLPPSTTSICRGCPESPSGFSTTSLTCRASGNARPAIRQ
jgi:hypothetical protein